MSLRNPIRSLRVRLRARLDDLACRRTLRRITGLPPWAPARDVMARIRAEQDEDERDAWERIGAGWRRTTSGGMGA